MRSVFVLCTFYFILLLTGLHPVVSQEPIYRFEHITTKDGLPSTAIYSLLLDSYGFIWIATRNGLCRYDGYEIKVYQYDPEDSTSISGNFLQSRIMEDDDGNIWVGTLANGLNRYNRETDNFTRYLHDPDDPKSLSYNSVWSLFQDSEGIIWIGTTGGSYSPGGRGLNRFNASGENFTSFLVDKLDPGSKKNRVNVIKEDDGKLLIGTKEGLYIFDRKSGQFFILEILDSSNSELLQNSEIESITIDGDSLYWIGTNDGLFKYFKQNQSLQEIPSGIPGPEQLGGKSFRNEMIIDPFEDERVFWIGSNYGLYKYWPGSGKVIGFLHETGSSEGIISDFVSDMVLDNTGRLWISGYPDLNVINLKSIYYKYYDIVFPGDDYKYSASSFGIDKSGFLWIGTTFGGLVKYDSMMNIVAHYPEFTMFDPQFNNTNVRELLIDSKDQVWIGCSGSGMHFLDNNLDQPVPCRFPEISPYPPLVVTELIEDHKQVIWVGTRMGLFVLDTNATSIPTFTYASLGKVSKYRIEGIFEDSRNRIWIGTFGDGLICLPSFYSDTTNVIAFLHDPENPGSIPSNEVIDIGEDNDGNVWFGTSRGVCKYIDSLKTFERYSLKEDVNIDLIYFLLCDRNGDFWSPSETGLIRFDPRGEKRTRIFSRSDGTPMELINYFNLYQNERGEIYVGGMLKSGDGFYKFHPDSIKDNMHIPEVLITDFQVKNKPFPLDSGISFKNKIELGYNQNFFSFSFVSLDLTEPDRNQYKYYLERFDEDWIYAGNRRFASYTGVPPGNYTFRVKGSNNDGYWNEEGTSIRITIIPPLWKTWWAYVLYGLVLLLLVYGLRRYDLKRQRLKQRLELEQVEAEKLKELDRMKSRFFANISHEFRTPLTLILGPLNGLLKRSRDNKTKQELGVMQRNAIRLQRLINQLLNLSKLESGKMKLMACEMDAIQLVKGYSQSFESLAKQKDIELVFNSQNKSIPLWVDQEKLEKILFNLLSNAFKFTAEDGRIEVKVNSQQPAVSSDSQITYHKSHITYLVISISDTGPGIPPENLPHIFDRFYQSDETYTKDGEGTGIGLALTKELVELHHGVIEVESVVGKGSTFRVYLPLGREHLTEEQMDGGHLTPFTPQPPIPPLLEERGPGGEVLEPKSPIILIVEDNADLRLYIRGYLDQDYNVIEAKDGKQGFERAIEHVPDLIISDVMMPVMDGFELTSKLKSDQRTSHIPVVLLTARACMESKIEGLETGADDFITKPFDPLELQTRVRNLIQQRLNLRELYGGEVRKGDLSLINNIPLSGLTELDQNFIRKAYEVVEKNFSDPEFSVDKFGKEMAISRVHLHRKLKALIDHSATEFIRTFRLNKAADLLKRKTATISEIAYDVGFNTVPYFTKCFQEHFGMPPSSYFKKEQ